MKNELEALKIKTIKLETLAEANIKRRKGLVGEYKKLKLEMEEASKDLQDSHKIFEVYKQVIINLREQTYVKISSIVNFGIKSVFNDKYEFKIDVKERGGKPTCQFLVKTDKLPHFVSVDKAQTSHGDGLMEIIAFLLQVTVHTVYNAPDVIFLDESFRRLKADRMESVGNLLRELSKTLGIQFICTTHDDKLASYADHVIQL